MKLRSIKPEDVKKVHQFWQEHYEVSKKDTVERIVEFIQKNPGLSTLAEDDGKVVGTALGAYDGRKGYIQKVSVHKDYRGTGLGQKLVKETVDKIKKAGALDIRVNCGEELIDFYGKAAVNYHNTSSSELGILQIKICRLIDRFINFQD